MNPRLKRVDSETPLRLRDSVVFVATGLVVELRLRAASRTAAQMSLFSES